MMATSLTARGGAQIKESIYAWEGKDKSGKTVRGELRAGGEAIVNVTLRRQGVLVTKVKKKVYRSGKKVRDRRQGPRQPVDGQTHHGPARRH
jgi:type IV pilus assembly protein PilC